MSEVLKVHVESERLNVDVSLPKRGGVVFYGANGAGKTSLMRVLRFVFGEGSVNMKPGFKLTVSVDNNMFSEVSVDKDGRILFRDADDEEPYVRDVDSIQARLSSLVKWYLGLPKIKVAWVSPDSIVISRNVYSIYSPPQPSPEVLEAIEESAYELLCVYRLAFTSEGLMAKVGGSWKGMHELSYGVRKSLALLFAQHLANVLFVEVFEAGLHADLAVRVLNHLSTEMDGEVFVETHLGLIVANALKHGWKAYYMDKGVTKKELNNIQDLKDAEIFEREIRALGLA